MYAYNLKKTLITSMEQKFFSAIKKALPEGYLVFPQINLATFIQATDSTVYHNELFRNVDFLVTDAAYKPRIAIEINDQTHRQSDRKERDKKVKDICAEAGIPLVSFWTSYGVNQEYIQKKLQKRSMHRRWFALKSRKKRNIQSPKNRLTMRTMTRTMTRTMENTVPGVTLRLAFTAHMIARRFGCFVATGTIH